MCRFSNEGRSKAFRQTSHGNKALSPLQVRLLIDVCLGLFNVVSDSISPTKDAVDESSDSDFRSSVSTLGGDEEVDDDELIRDLDNNEVDKSKGDSVNKNIKFVTYTYILNVRVLYRAEAYQFY